MRMDKIAKGESTSRKETKGRGTWGPISLDSWGEMEESAKQKNEAQLVRQAIRSDIFCKPNKESASGKME